MNILSFKGIADPYTNKNGFKVTPIAQNPSQTQIDEAIEATQTKPIGQGMNGRAYFLGEDLVVKHYLKDESVSYNPDRELRALDKMFDKGVNNKQIQEGKYAFTSPDGEAYLVSSRIEGKSISKNNKITEKNISSIVKALEGLDKPILKDELKEDNFPFETFMHYDLTMGNINVSENAGGIIDFEWSNTRDLEEYFEQDKNFGCIMGTDCNLSDIVPVISNIRGFEFNSLCEQLQTQDPSEAKELFSTYLKEKSKYEYSMAEQYGKYASKNEVSKTIAEKYKNHAYLLKGASVTDEFKDIKESEAIKIQLANFINRQSPMQTFIARKINPKQIMEYSRFAQKFFEEKFEISKEYSDKKRMDYYKDCIKLVQNLSGVEGWLNWQLTSVEEKTANGGWSKEDIEHLKKEYALIQSKLTDKYETTLEEIVCD